MKAYNMETPDHIERFEPRFWWSCQNSKRDEKKKNETKNTSISKSEKKAWEIISKWQISKTAG